jgi:carbonic anhydrase
LTGFQQLSVARREAFVDEVAGANVLRTVSRIRNESPTLDRLVRQGQIAIVGAMYDVATGGMAFLVDDSEKVQLQDGANGVQFARHTGKF